MLSQTIQKTPNMTSECILEISCDKHEFGKAKGD